MKVNSSVVDIAGYSWLTALQCLVPGRTAPRRGRGGALVRAGRQPIEPFLCADGLTLQTKSGLLARFTGQLGPVDDRWRGDSVRGAPGLREI